MLGLVGTRQDVMRGQHDEGFVERGCASGV